MPNGFNGAGIVLHIGQDGGRGAYIMQLACGLNNENLYYRFSTNDGISWENWKKITLESIV